MPNFSNVALEERWIKSAEVNLRFMLGGRGEVLFLLHGWPGFWKDWEKLIPHLITDFRLVAPDLRGFGLSDKPRSPEAYTLDHYSEDIAALMDGLGLRTAFLAGFDVGAIVAAYFASRKRDQVKGLVLMNPSYPGLGKKRLELPYASENWYQLFHLTELAEDLVGYNRETVKIYLSYFYNRWSFRKTAFSEQDIEEYVDTYFRQGLWGGFNWYRARFKTRYSYWLKDRLDVKTLIIWSDKDPVFPLEWSEGVKEFFPNAMLTYIKNCGHFIPREAPEETADLIRRFLLKQ
jgi:pimeloyl-ACP methyl ester carboxylesterase